MAGSPNKYLITGHRFGPKKRGGYTIPSRFCSEHSEYCEFIEDRELRNVELIKKLGYKRVIFWTQVPRCYSFPLNFLKLREIDHVIYLRDEWVNDFYNSCNNGFHYYRTYDQIKHFVPMITDFNVDDKSNDLCFGFYVRKTMIPDSYDCFLDILSSLKFKVNLYVMGDDDHKLKHHQNVLTYTHTHDNKTFFRNVTHYFYPTSKSFQDPFPHSVLEAVQAGRQVIFPEIDRNHKDGIDDIKDCVKWHQTFNDDIYLDNSDHPLKPELFKNFYTRLFANNFEYSFDRSKFKNMREWIEYEI